MGNKGRWQNSTYQLTRATEADGIIKFTHDLLGLLMVTALIYLPCIKMTTNFIGVVVLSPMQCLFLIMLSFGCSDLLSVNPFLKYFHFGIVVSGSFQY